MIQNLLRDLKNKLLQESTFKNNIAPYEIRILFESIFKILMKDHTLYRVYIPQLINIIESSEHISLNYLADLFFNNYGLLFNLETRELNVDFLDKNSKDDIKDLLALVEKRLKQDNIIRFSETEFDLTSLTIKEKEDYLAILINFIQIESERYVWDSDTINNLHLILTIGRNIAEQTNNLEFFYFSIGNFVDSLNNSGFTQQARDYAEEFLISTFNNKLSEYGFYLSFRVYSHQSNVLVSLLYANLMFSELLDSQKTLNNKLLKEIVTQSIIFFRKVSMWEIVEQLYSNIPINISFSGYEKRSLEFSYLVSQLYKKAPDFPYKYADFLNRNREDILTVGDLECTPLLLILYNTKMHYSECTFKDSTLDQYITLLENVVPKTKLKDQKIIVFGDSPHLKDLFRESLNKLSFTRHKSDFINDVSQAIIIANKLVLFSFKASDYEAFLFAMLIKSDFSTIFSTKESDFLIPASYLVNKHNEFSNFISNPVKAIQELDISIMDSIFLFANSGSQIYQMIYNGELNIYELNNFHSEHVLNWSKNQIGFLKFENTIHDGIVRNKSPEEYSEETLKVKQSLDFARVKNFKGENILLVKDMDISSFPHNLFLNEKDEFLFLKKPIINILSLEWFSKSKTKDNRINENYSKSIWIPTERGDLSINLLFKKLKDTLESNKFNITRDFSIEKAISSDISIITAHGNNEISTFHALYTNEMESINELDSIVGEGKILILFICHSGSMKKSEFGNKIASLSKYFLENGYQTVIAPYWSLSIDLPPIWLPEFLNQFNSGETVLSSFHHASLAIKKVYPTPSAWACLHIYGNPYLRII